MSQNGGAHAESLFDTINLLSGTSGLEKSHGVYSTYSKQLLL